MAATTQYILGFQLYEWDVSGTLVEEQQFRPAFSEVLPQAPDSSNTFQQHDEAGQSCLSIALLAHPFGLSNRHIHEAGTRSFLIVLLAAGCVLMLDRFLPAGWKCTYANIENTLTADWLTLVATRNVLVAASVFIAFDLDFT